MPRRVRLLAAELHYGSGIHLHTASSGAVDALDEVYLIIEDGDAVVAMGGVRTNIAYLVGTPEIQFRAAILALVAELDWGKDLERLYRDFTSTKTGVSAAARTVVDCALLDGLAREAALPLAEHLGAEFRPEIATNQTLFWSSDTELERNVQLFLAAGFRELKLRVGIGAFTDDLRRLRRVREIAGDTVALAIDANGVWPPEDAAMHLRALAPLGLAYAEQPIPPGDWRALARLSAESPVPIMLDESLASPHDVELLARNRAAPLAHLKLVKLGGITSLLTAARQLSEAGIELMIGQMNEGALATAAAAHATLVVQPRYAELYGAYGLLDDPVNGLAYRQGRLQLDRRPGLGVDLDTSRLIVLWEKIL